MVTAILLLIPLLTACGIHCYFCKPNGSCTHCNSGWYGSGCTSPCPPTYPGGCHKTTGKTCLEGTYGNLYQGKCSPNSNGCRLCNRRDCAQGCQKGFHGSNRRVFDPAYKPNRNSHQEPL